MNNILSQCPISCSPFCSLCYNLMNILSHQDIQSILSQCPISCSTSFVPFVTTSHEYSVSSRHPVHSVQIPPSPVVHHLFPLLPLMNIPSHQDIQSILSQCPIVHHLFPVTTSHEYSVSSRHPVHSVPMPHLL